MLAAWILRIEESETSLGACLAYVNPELKPQYHHKIKQNKQKMPDWAS
jgi:hypothetical protein